MNELHAETIDRRRFIGLAATAGVAVAAGALLGGCSSEDATPRSAGVPAPEPETPTPTDEAPASEEPAADAPATPKALVAVFSWSGHTLQMAERVNELVGGDFFRIQPAEAYTTDYNAVLDVAQSEQDSDYRPALAATVEAWERYDTVYLGYPVWWYHVPQIIKTFVEEHDLTGKTIVPFATSGGTSITGTLADIEALCPGVQFAESLTLDGDSVASQLDRVDVWIDGLGLR